MIMTITTRFTGGSEGMGLFDTVEVFQRCPHCKDLSAFTCQTNDLGRGMYCYRALDKDWFSKKGSSFSGRAFRQRLRVYPRFPLDKTHKVWKNQAELREAGATVTLRTNASHINVIAECIRCERSFEGKLDILHRKGRRYLVGPVYDLRKRKSR